MPPTTNNIVFLNVVFRFYFKCLFLDFISRVPSLVSNFQAYFLLVWRLGFVVWMHHTMLLPLWFHIIQIHPSMLAKILSRVALVFLSSFPLKIFIINRLCFTTSSFLLLLLKDFIERLIWFCLKILFHMISLSLFFSFHPICLYYPPHSHIYCLQINFPLLSHDCVTKKKKQLNCKVLRQG